MKRKTWIGPPVSNQKHPCQSREDSRLKSPVMAIHVLIADLNRSEPVYLDLYKQIFIFMGKIEAIIH